MIVKTDPSDEETRFDRDGTENPDAMIMTAMKDFS